MFVQHPESISEAEDLTVRAAGAAGSLVEFQGYKPRTFCQLAQPAAMTGSQPSRHGGPTSTENTHTSAAAQQQHSHMLCLSLQGILKDDIGDLRSITELQATDRTAVSTFPPSVTSVKKLKWDQTSQDVMSTHMLTSAWR